MEANESPRRWGAFLAAENHDCVGTYLRYQLPRNSSLARAVPTAFSKYSAIIAARSTNYHYVALLRPRVSEKIIQDPLGFPRACLAYSSASTLPPSLHLPGSNTFVSIHASPSRVLISHFLKQFSIHNCCYLLQLIFLLLRSRRFLFACRIKYKYRKAM